MSQSNLKVVNLHRGEQRNRMPARESNTGALGCLQTSAGKVVHDPRGTAVYDWAVATATFTSMSPSDLLGILDNTALKLEDESAPTRWTGDPYNRN
jgi:hypothetical protein